VVIDEPILTEDDHRVWDMWMRTARIHARTLGYLRRLNTARRVASEEIERAELPVVMWSGGKDSTVLVHLVRVGLGLDIEAISEKDDLDYPGEREYVEGLAAAWSLRLTIVEPEVSPASYLAAHGAEQEAWADVHSRRAGLSKACFYGVLEAATAPHDTILLGLRKHESRHRMRNRTSRGLAYTKRDGKRIVQPLGDWSGLDVMAYMATHGIEPLPVYRCVAFMHADEPWRVRKSWWVPGSSGAKGGVAWLARYYPSLYRRLREWMPGVEALR